MPWNLSVSYIGYATQTLVVKSIQEGLNIQLSDDPHQLNEVVVSANKRLQSLQQIPMSITAISPLALRRAGHVQFTDFASGVPNLGFSPSGSGNLGRANYGVSIRGIEGTGTTAFYLDEIPLPEDISIRMLDVARIAEAPAEAFLIFAPYTLLNARIGLEFSNYRLSIFGRNLTNTIANFGTPRAFNGEVPGRARYSISRPLTIGVQAGVFF